MRNKLFIVLSLIVAASMILSACAAPTAEKVVETVVVKEVQTQVVEKEGQTVVVTATPEAAAPAAAFNSKDPTTFVNVEFGEPETLDPALDYETGGGEVIQNVYDTLITYDREKPTSFVPMLATEVPSMENGGITNDGKTYTFKIRTGVKFHNGDDMTPADVAYTFQRGVLQGGSASPQWLLVEPFFGIGLSDIAELVDPSGALVDDPEGLKAADPATLKSVCEKAQAAIVADDAAGTVTFNLAQAWGPFIPTLANFWGGIQDAKWTAENGGWDGSCDTWQNFYGITSENDPFNDKMNGTGPFMFDHWTKGQELVMVRNPNYWVTEPLFTGGKTGPAALERVVIKFVTEWGTRFAMLQAGDADTVSVNRTDIAQIDPMVGELCTFNLDKGDYDACVASSDQPFRLYKGAPSVSRTDAFMTFVIATSEESPNPLLGSGKLDGNGIPPDFFSDVHIRKAFNYCFDWGTYINDALAGEAFQSVGVELPGMPGYDPNGPKYTYDPAKCEEEFKAADLDHDGIPAGDDPEGDVWTTGFRMQVAYNQGNTVRQTIAEILAGDLASVNELFSVEIVGLPWPTFLRNQRAKSLPIFFSGWIEDIHDPHNWFQPYVLGTYGGRQNLPTDVQDELGALINAGVAESDPAKRAEIYTQLNQQIYDLAPQIILAVATGRFYDQRWVDGYYNNPITPGLYYYNLSKK
jgi:peptide/nickel transport system substrate-binding protein